MDLFTQFAFRALAAARARNGPKAGSGGNGGGPFGKHPLSAKQRQWHSPPQPAALPQLQAPPPSQPQQPRCASDPSVVLLPRAALEVMAHELDRLRDENRALVQRAATPACVCLHLSQPPALFPGLSHACPLHKVGWLFDGVSGRSPQAFHAGKPARCAPSLAVCGTAGHHARAPRRPLRRRFQAALPGRAPAHAAAFGAREAAARRGASAVRGDTQWGVQFPPCRGRDAAVDGPARSGGTIRGGAGGGEKRARCVARAAFALASRHTA